MSVVKCREMSASGRILTAKQESAIVALLSYPTIAEAARAVKVTDRTLFRWLQDPAFQEAYRRARWDAIGQAISQLQQGAREAVDCLRKRARGYTVLEEEFKRDSRGKRVRFKKTRKELHPDVAAARAILELAMEAAKTEDLEARIVELERALKRRH